MKSKFPELFEYNFHSNNNLIKNIENQADLIPDKVIKLLNHILNSHQVWNARILNQDTFQVWQINLLDELNDINRSNYENSLLILDKFNFDKTIQYRNSQGLEFINKIEDILFHVVNHSTYHRAQIALLFRESGNEPLISDYIVYKR